MGPRAEAATGDAHVLRHFNQISICDFDDNSLGAVYTAICRLVVQASERAQGCRLEAPWEVG